MAQVDSIPSIHAIDMFCGAGGLTYGLAQAGIEVVAGVDVDPACRYPYEANNAAMFIEDDVSSLSASSVAEMINGGNISMIAGCAPCQPFSTYSQAAQKRHTRKDWQLVSVFGSLVEQVQPTLVTMENVPQLVKHPVFREFLHKLSGYSVEWSIVQAARMGIPQTRRRLVLIASKLGEQGLALSHRYEQRTVRQVLTPLRPLKAGETDPHDPLHAAPRLSPKNLERIQHSTPGGTWRDWPEELQAACHRKQSGSTYPSVYGRMSWDAPSPTITTQCYGYGNGRFGHPEQDRAISLREAAILQTFPADYEFAPPEEAIRFSTLGRLIGNAVPPRLGQIVGEAVINHVNHAA